MNIKQYSFQFNMPVSIYCGPEIIQKLPEISIPYGTNMLLVTSKDIKHIEDKIIAVMTKLNLKIEKFYIESPEPTSEFIDSSATILSSKKYDVILGVGGGSVIDMAKALSIALTNPEPIWMYANLSDRQPKPLINKTIPVIAVPTTSGTGSEVTPYAVLTKQDTHQKGTIQEQAIFPRVALIDPTLMQTMPMELTMSTGIDAFAHAIESYINISKPSPVSEWAGAEAMRLIFENLPAVYENPNDLELRMNMAWASSLAGIAIAHRGTTTTHAIAEPLGALTNIPHAHCVTVSTLPVLKKTWKRAIDKFTEIYEITNRDHTTSVENKAEALVLKIEELLESVNMNRTVSYYLHIDEIDGLKEKLLENVLKYKFRPLKQHIIEFNKEEISTIIDEIIGN